MDEPILSIIVPTYNHEKYISTALDSILMQKTNFTYEILIGEDCSTDGTRKILQEYEARYPGKFQVFYRRMNMYHQELRNEEDLLLRSRGKYLIILEGDDFWIDPQKLEKQISFLESNYEYYAVSHNCIVVGEYGFPSGEIYPECKDKEYTIRHFAAGILPGQTATIMTRNYIKDSSFHNDYGRLPSGTPGDWVLAYKLLVNGRIYCMQEVMSAYRHVTTHGSSFSANYKYDLNAKAEWYELMLDYTEKYKREWLNIIKMKFLGNIIHGVRKHYININTALYYTKKDKLLAGFPLYVKQKKALLFPKEGRFTLT